MPEPEPSLADVLAQISERSNWSRWGPDDQRGAVNLIDQHKRLEAISAVRIGRTVSLGRDFPKASAPNNPRPAQHYLRIEKRRHGWGFVADHIGIDYHGAASTHLDALCHMWDENGAWGGRKSDEFLTPGGATWGGVEHWRDGILTRGVLLDVPAYRGVPYVTGDIPVHGAELTAIAEHQGVELRAGDAIVVHCGREAYEAEHGPWGTGNVRPGLHASCLSFLRDVDCSVLLWDMQDAAPQTYDSVMPFTVHASLFAYGVALVDNPQLADLSDACREEGQYDFLLVLAPLAIVGGTGSPINPIALL